MSKPSEPMADRLARKVEPDLNTGCWLWNGNMTTTGYGLISFPGRKQMAAHRASWITFKGEIPPSGGYHGTCVCHRCDTPLRINPDHLFLGTHDDNMADVKRKKRRFDTRSILTKEQRERIRIDLRRNCDIAQEYKVDPSIICRVKRGRKAKGSVSC